MEKQRRRLLWMLGGLLGTALLALGIWAYTKRMEGKATAVAPAEPLDLPRYAQAKQGHEPNRLLHERSPYLRAAGHQPVKWYPWGEEAFRAARKQDRPILLDIGAVWCHWCHVMDRETYENPEIAKIINENFIPVKVDRDERPDVDRRYMEAVVALTGSGGWPLTAFLTPEGKVFFGGTYFPPEDRGGLPGMKRLLPQVAQVYRDQKSRVVQEAERLASHLRKSGAPHPGEISRRTVEKILEGLEAAFDPENGGFGRGTKFPAPAAIQLLFWSHDRTDNSTHLAMATRTLSEMIRGGIHDHLGGGIHRYSVDPQWRVPHFEKMAYDNAEFLINTLHAWQATGQEEFRGAAEGVVKYVEEVLSDAERGGFYAFQDADIDLEDDGDYWTWTDAEIGSALGEEEKVFRAVFDIRKMPRDLQEPQRAERNVLRMKRTPEEAAKELGLPEKKLRETLEAAKARLLEVRKKRSAPYVDKSLIASYNGQMIRAFLEAYKVLGRRDAGDLALKTLARWRREAWDPEKGLLRILGDERKKERPQGFLDDQVWMAAAALAAYEVTSRPEDLEFARALLEWAWKHLWDEKEGGFHDRPPADGPSAYLAHPNKDFSDNPTPSANSLAAYLLDRLGFITGEPSYAEKAEKVLKSAAGGVAGFGSFGAMFAIAAWQHLDPPVHAVIIGPAEGKTDALWEAALRTWRPGKILGRFTPADPASRLPAPVAAIVGSQKGDGKPIAYVCAGLACSAPISEPEELARRIRDFGRPAATQRR